MAGQADRWTGAFFVAVAAVLYFHVIPTYVETVEYGWVHPRTIPNAVAVIVAVCGVAQIIGPAKVTVPPARQLARAGLFFALIVAGLVLTAFLGFKIVAPLLALVIMLAIGERRPGWLAAGVIGIPLAIWLFVAFLLGRPLP